MNRPHPPRDINLTAPVWNLKGGRRGLCCRGGEGSPPPYYRISGTSYGAVTNTWCARGGGRMQLYSMHASSKKIPKRPSRYKPHHALPPRPHRLDLHGCGYRRCQPIGFAIALTHGIQHPGLHRVTITVLAKALWTCSSDSHWPLSFGSHPSATCRNSCILPIHSVLECFFPIKRFLAGNKSQEIALWALKSPQDSPPPPRQQTYSCSED